MKLIFKPAENHNTSPDALIFDMDGTLWDAVETYTLAWNLYFDRHQIDKQLKKIDLDVLMGLEESKFLEKVLPDFSPNERSIGYEEVVEIQYDLIDKIGGEMYDGVLDYLPRLNEKYNLFIVSNCPKYTIKHFIKFAKIEKLIIDSVSHGQNYKPKHENIRLLIDKHDLKSPVYIGDTASDMDQSVKAKLPFIFMNYGFGQCNSYHKSFDSFTEFANYFLEKSF